MVITIFDLVAGIRERKAELGIVDTPDRTEQMRNAGSRRTASKRAMLARLIHQKCPEGLAGVA